MVVTQHEIVALACVCGHHTPAPAPAEASAPVAYGPRIAAVGIYLLHGQFLSIGRTATTVAEVFGVPVSAGTVACWVKRTALSVIDAVLPMIRDRIAAAPVAHFDETGWRTAGGLAWLHAASTPTDVFYTVHPKRGTAAMNDAGVLPMFTGVAVHDAWAPYDTYTAATHALCNAHVLRELRRSRQRGLIRLAAATVVVDADRPEIPVAIDGEALLMPTPVRCTTVPGALRVRLPKNRPGVPPAKPAIVELDYEGGTIRFTVADQLEWEFELEIDGDEVELEIELKWSNAVPVAPAASGTPAEPVQRADSAEPASARRRTKSSRCSLSIFPRGWLMTGGR